MELLPITVITPERVGGDLLVMGCFEGEKPVTAGLASGIRTKVVGAARRKDWKGRSGQSTRLPSAEPRVGQVSLLGLGSRGRFDRVALRGWLRRALGEARSGGCRRLSLQLPDHESCRGSSAALAVLATLALAEYRFDEFRSERPGPRLTGVQLLPPSGEESTYRRLKETAQIVAGGTALARDLSNTPPNVATPEWMAGEAGRIARQSGMKIEILTPRDMTRRRMGGILAVGGGSSNPPRLVRLEWGEGERVVALVGKGVTFDTGGISIKPARAMDEMKHDKSGACTVLGISQALAALDLPARFRAYLPLAENMPDGLAYRPGDIVRCYNGKTVEIINTDAEGRMILADALSWAAREKPDALVEYSTLTGAAVVALGQHGAALYSPDDGLAEELLRAGQESGERLWRMPLWPEFKREIRGKHADLRNSAGRWGGANTAAAFLSNFVKGAGSWAHLDIAGTAYVGSGQKGRRGATGFGVGLTANWLLESLGRI